MPKSMETECTGKVVSAGSSEQGSRKALTEVIWVVDSMKRLSDRVAFPSLPWVASMGRFHADLRFAGQMLVPLAENGDDYRERKS